MSTKKIGMRRKKMISIALLLLLVATSVFVWADTSDPGSSDDPVVTKSYVDAKIAELSAEKTGNDAFEVVFIEKGKKLIGKEGTELILRSGTAIAVDIGMNGLSDLTSAKELMGGSAVGTNHLIIVPRADGRGISAGTDIYVMIKGSYTIE